MGLECELTKGLLNQLNFLGHFQSVQTALIGSCDLTSFFFFLKNIEVLYSDQWFCDVSRGSSELNELQLDDVL